MDHPLSDIKVVELASVLAGPAIGMFLAELGAEVIKVENAAQGGDMTRSWKLASEDPSSPISAYFSSVNYMKTHVFLDLKNEKDKEEVYRLIASSDIVINNMKDSSVIKFGLDYDYLKELNPKLILAELSGYLKDESKVAFDVVLQAEIGYISMTGTGEVPAKLPLAFIDMIAAHQLKEAILLALYKREQDGKGAHIRASLEEAAISSLANQATNYLMQGHIARRMGTLHPNIAPYGEIITTQDGVQFILAIGTQVQFEKLCTILESDKLSTDERYSHNRVRVQNRNELIIELQAVVSMMTSQTFERDCDALRVPIGRIRTLDEVLEGEVAQEMVRSEVMEGISTKRISSIAFRMER